MLNDFIYFFDDIPADILVERDIFGGKAKALIELVQLGLPIPNGLVITTELCKYYYAHNKTLPQNFTQHLKQALNVLETKTGKTFGTVSEETTTPLLVSVRSGAPVSMPGMMDTILNIGLNEQTIQFFINQGNERFVLDSYRRLIQMYGNVVLGVPHQAFEQIIDQQYAIQEISNDSQLQSTYLGDIILAYKQLITSSVKEIFPDDPYTQLINSIKAVLDSWMSTRAIAYRKIHNIPDEFGTAIIIQTMVFGNLDNESATGVVFTRNPSNGLKYLYGEYLINSQGEDIVAGVRTPLSMDEHTSSSMKNTLPESYATLVNLADKLEKHYKDMQDIEFTIEQNNLYILQTRAGKRSALAAIKIAVDMVKEGLINKTDAILRIKPDSLNQLLHATIDYSQHTQILTQALPASPGAACGMIVFSAAEAEAFSNDHKTILVRHDTSPEDINGMHVAAGILTSRGGMTSHAAVVARGMGKPCVCGASAISIDSKARTVHIGEIILKAGDYITIDGTNGKVILGQAHVIPQELPAEFIIFMQWVNEHKRLEVRANAESLLDIEAALKFGAEAIGLCRTEHMFFEITRLNLLRQMIISYSTEERQIALDKLLSLHQYDFLQIFKLVQHMPVTIRLLDPPLHEFLPHHDSDIKELASILNTDIKTLEDRVNSLRETNPMIGHRGCRLAITFPEIYEMQLIAIFEAAYQAKNEYNCNPKIEIIIPFISNIQELIIISKQVSNVAKNIYYKYSQVINYSIGTMIELPRAALISDEIAEFVEFFSFGTNDLTQTTYGISRDDISSYLKSYLNQNIFSEDPFIQIDEQGVGSLIKIAIDKARETRADIKLGVCGEHGGNPASINFFESLNLDYISCSPYRVPIARLAAAQSYIRSK